MLGPFLGFQLQDTELLDKVQQRAAVIIMGLDDVSCEERQRVGTAQPQEEKHLKEGCKDDQAKFSPVVLEDIGTN